MCAVAAAASSRDRMLDAAERLVSESGASNLTLDAVAHAAGVSKGGLLYHFPSKDALLEGMLDRHLEELDARIGGAPGLHAIVLAVLESVDSKRAVGAALVAASAANPALMARCRRHYAETLKSLQTPACRFEEAAVILLAVDGLVLGELMQLSPYTPRQRQCVVEALLRRAAAFDLSRKGTS